ncbi:hypothetical protein LTS18_014456, partial [Coniosporium uncinatum]
MASTTHEVINSRAESAAITRINTACLCGRSRYRFSAPTALEAHLCHCTTSRKISGTICTSYVRVPSIPENEASPDLSTLTGYKSSDILTRHFCSTCGTHMFLEDASDGHFEVSTGSLDRSDGVVQFKGHMWVGDTRDGGASVWVPSIGNRVAERWLEAPNTSQELPSDWRDTAPPTHETQDHVTST